MADDGANTIGCLGKIGYPTRAEASNAQRRLYAKPGYVKGGDGRSVVKLQPYHCPRCGRFHLGRNPKVGGINLRRRGLWKDAAARYRELTK